MADSTSGAAATDPKPAADSQPASQTSFGGLSADDLAGIARAAAKAQIINTELSLSSASAQLVSASLPLGSTAAVPAALAGVLPLGSSNNVTSAGITDNTLSALLLNSGLGMTNFNSTAALSGLLNDMTANTQTALTQPTGSLLALGYGTLGQSSAAATDDDADGKTCTPSNSNKQLSSRYRGVCWNKKNKRWQAAINSGGKYIYLGSFTSEHDAARQFDRAAIKIRGKKAKLNFSYAEYVDAEGNLLEDLVLPTGIPGKEDRPGQGPRSSTAGKTGSGADGLFYDGEGNIGDAGVPGLASNLQAGNPLSALSAETILGLLPQGSQVESLVPGLDGIMFGVVYKTEAGQRGSGFWTGHKFYSLGECRAESESDARQLLQKMMEMLHEDRQIRLTGAASLTTAPSGLNTVNNSKQTAAAAAAAEPLVTVLALGGLKSGGTGSSSSWLNTGVTSSAAAGFGDVANLDIARAAQLALEAAQQQGVDLGMTLPRLPTSLQPARSEQQQQDEVEAELQFRLQQIIQQTDLQQQQQQLQQQQQEASDAMFDKLANLDMAALQQVLLRQQAPTVVTSQQQQQQQPVRNSNMIGGSLGSLSIEEFIAGIGGKPTVTNPAAAGAGSAASMPASITAAANWSDILSGLSASNPAAGSSLTTVPASAAAGLGQPAAKRMRLSDAAAAAADAVVAGDDVGGLNISSLTTSGNLQDALKQIAALSAVPSST